MIWIMSVPMREPPVYRPFAAIAFLATLAIGTPVGVWMASWLYMGARAVPFEWVALHPHIQIFSFFGVLIVGVAHHLFARFTGRAVTRGPLTRWLLALLAASIALRVAGTWTGRPFLVAAASSAEAAAFAAFGGWVWRSLDLPALARLRRHLTVSTAWLAVACLIEAASRWEGVRAGRPVPGLEVLRATHAMGLYGGVIGWVLGVLLRAGPMFAPGWHVPTGAQLAAPLLLGAGVLIAAVGETGPWPPTAGVPLSRLGELIALATLAVVMLTSGALRRVRNTLPMLGRTAEETRLFPLALASAAAAVIVAAAATAMAAAGRPVHLLADAVRHLVTVGFLTSVVVAMAFRLIPVIEGRGLPWPRLRGVAFWALLVGVLLRGSTLLLGLGWNGPAPWVPLSGVFVAAAVACVAVNLARIVAAARERVGFRATT